MECVCTAATATIQTPDTLVHTFLSTVHVLFTAAISCTINVWVQHFSLHPTLVGKTTVVSVQGLDWQRKKWGPTLCCAADGGTGLSRVAQHHHGRIEKSARALPFALPQASYICAERDHSSDGGVDFEASGWGLTAGNYILFLGRFSREKNCHLLIQAYKRSKLQ